MTTRVATFVEDGFAGVVEFANVDAAGGFASGFTAGASHYGAGACMAVTWPFTLDERADIVECYSEEVCATAEAACAAGAGR